MKRVILATGLLLASKLAFACGDDQVYPHELERSKGILYNTNQCVPVRVLAPMRHKDGVINLVLLTVASNKVEANTLEVDMAFHPAHDKENRSEIHICVNHEIAPNMRLELQYKPVPDENGVVKYSLCGPTTYVIDDFMSHLTGS